MVVRFEKEGRIAYCGLGMISRASPFRQKLPALVEGRNPHCSGGDGFGRTEPMNKVIKIENEVDPVWEGRGLGDYDFRIPDEAAHLGPKRKSRLL